MNTDPITPKVGNLTPSQEIRLRDTAKQFEALLLTQLTSVLAKSSGKDSIYGSDAGSDLAQKMFSEQLAMAMAEGGGIGIADTFLKSVGYDPSKPAPKLGKIDDLKIQPTINSVSDATPSTLKSPIPNSSQESSTPRDLVFEVPTGNKSKVQDSGGIGVVSVDEESVDDKVWRAPFVDASQGVDVTRKENQISGEQSRSYVMPVEGRISSRYGMRFHPIHRTQKFHGGLDIAAPTGTPIKAAFDGTVTFAGRRGGYGNLVEIKHTDGRTTRYAHANTIGVEVGAEVKAGDVIATVGSTGKSTGPHLHFEVRENGKPINPARVIN